MELPADHPNLFAPPPQQQQRPARPAQPLARTGERAALSLTLPLFADAADAADAPDGVADAPVVPGLRTPAQSPGSAAAAAPSPAPALPVGARAGAPEPAPPHPAPRPPPAPPAAPEALHPALWRAHQVARTAHAVWPSGFAELDPQLPGGGWPAGMLTELLLPHPGVGELRLLAPVLVGLQTQQRSVMWFDPPAQPCPWALGALGLDMRQQLVVQSRPRATVPPLRGPQGRAPGQAPMQARAPAADILWALEQALKSGQVGAVLAWLPPRLPADALRRLQLAAQLHEGPVFLLRAAEERSRASAAPLRLLLSAWGPDLLRVAIVKRRGAPLAEALLLELPPVLSAPALARALRAPARGAPWATPGPEGAGAAGPGAGGAAAAHPATAGATGADGGAATRRSPHPTHRPQ